MIKLFSYFKDIENEKSKKSVRDIKAYELSQSINTLIAECGDWIKIFPDDDCCLSIEEPEFQPCPQPHKTLEKWLPENWANRDIDEIQPLINMEKDEYFKNNPKLQTLWQQWYPQRKEWIKTCKQIHNARSIFRKLYNKNEQLLANENAEWIIGSGMWDMGNNQQHPLFLRRVRLHYHKDKNNQAIQRIEIKTVENSDMEIFYSAFSVDKIAKYMGYFSSEDMHPCDFLLSEQDNRYKNIIQVFEKIRIDQNKNFNQNNTQEVYLFVGKIQNILLQVLTKICDELDKELNLSPVLSNLQTKNSTIDDNKTANDYDDENEVALSLARDNGEDADILLTKPANKEQLEIVQKMRCHQAVVVQGPPGTGKTHTIANLIGHFLSEGKNILVVAQKEKALSVLKEKIDIRLQPLCISSIGYHAQRDLEHSTQNIKDYFDNFNQNTLERSIQEIKDRRENIRRELHQARKNLYLQRHKICQGIVVQGREYSVKNAAKKVASEKYLDIISGKVLRDTFPLNADEWQDLYTSHQSLTREDEVELQSNLPQLNNLISIKDFEEICHFLSDFDKQLQQYSIYGKSVHCNNSKQQITIQTPTGRKIQWQYSREQLEKLKNLCQELKQEKIEEWQKMIACQSKESQCEHWKKLTYLIKETKKQKDSANKIAFAHSVEQNIESMLPESDFIDLQTYLSKKGKIGFFAGKNIKNAANAVLIDNHPIQTVEDCNIALEMVRYWHLQQECSKYWQNLMTPLEFNHFDKYENTAHNYIYPIEKYLNWYSNVYHKINQDLQPFGLQISSLVQTTLQDTEQQKTNRDFQVVYYDIPELCDVLVLHEKQIEYWQQCRQAMDALVMPKNSAICWDIHLAIQNKDISTYSDNYQKLQNILSKQEKYQQRQKLLSKLQQFAPDWAKIIVSRQQTLLPERVDYHKLCEIWECKVLAQKLTEIYQYSEDEWQKVIEKEVINYRRITAEYAEHLAWQGLSTHYTDEIKQHLTIWAQLIKKIGKGTGKTAGEKRKKARAEMQYIQGIIPVWIMTIDQALQRFDACHAQFDIVIMDEASQIPLSSALPMLQMCKDKAIIIGDDQQTTPENVSIDNETNQTLINKQKFTNLGNIDLDSNYSVFNFTKIYFPNCGLKEHFRCVPEIIWYSNRLAYDKKIKPLRESFQNKLQPNFVVYRCSGERENKINQIEAKEIALLIKSCISQSEYEDKTFGVISLLGKEQIDIIQKELDKYITIEEREKHQILCGTSADFQGDERDVIFLSFVDVEKNDKNSVKTITADGNNGRYSKIYNVAVSRAKNQVWLIHSFDSELLSHNDVRKDLIDYAKNAHSIMQKDIEDLYGINARSDSEFEKEVAQALHAAGYSFQQQYPVGAYRIDIVVQGDKKRIALECDGEKWHSTPQQITNDMQRQTILERLGWQFIRLRGGQYYRDKEKAIQWLKDELGKYDIYPQQINTDSITPNNTELLNRVYKTKDDLKQQSLQNVQQEINFANDNNNS